MKFLCIECDEAMKLVETRGPDAGSMTVIFGCHTCGKQTAMLTNSMETQMVRALDVQIGGRSVPAEPMEKLRGTIAYQNGGSAEQSAAPEAPAAREMPQKAGDGECPVPHMEAAAQPAESAKSEEGGKCPFSGMVSDAFAAQESGFSWTADAEKRLENIPPFVRPMVKKSIEQQAKEANVTEINTDFMDRVKGVMGI